MIIIEFLITFCIVALINREFKDKGLGKIAWMCDLLIWQHRLF